jgi:hypothetical protein
MALKFEKACLKKGLDARIIPVPRELSSSCGFACCYPCDCEDAVAEAVSASNIKVAARHRVEDI